MTFLAPGLGLLVGAVGAAVLTLLSILKLRRKPIRVSSTMLWEQAVEDLQVNTPFRRFRASWWLLVQALAVALLAMAAGRPALEGAPVGGGRVVIVVDVSASMSAIDTDRGSRFDLARRRAGEILDALPADARVMLVSFASTTRVVSSFDRGAGGAERALDDLEPTDERSSVESLNRFLSALGPGEDADEPTQVFVVSDGNLGGSTVRANDDTDVRFVRCGPEPRDVTPRRARAGDNWGITAVSAIRSGEVVRVLARVGGSPGAGGARELVLRVNGSPLEARTVELGEQGASVNFEFISPGRALAEVELVGDDALASDNSAGLVVGVPTPTRVMLVAPASGVEDDPDAGLGSVVGGVARPDRFLAAVLRTIDGIDLREVTPGTYRALADGWAGDAGSPPPVDLLIFDRVTPISVPGVPSLSLGAGVPIEGLEWEERAPASAQRVILWDRNDPALRYVSLDGLWVRTTVVLGRGSDRAGVGTLMETPDGPAGWVLLDRSARTSGVRRVVLGFPISQSTWGAMLSFPVFIANVLDTLAVHESAGGESVRAGEPVTVRPEPGVDLVVAEGPVRLTRRVEEPGRVVLSGLTAAGVYAIEGVAAGDSVVRVNVTDPVETSLVSPEELVVGGLSGGSGVAVPGVGATRRELWRWFVLAALVLTSAEWFWFAVRSRAR